jgi:hypothetical protein
LDAKCCGISLKQMRELSARGAPYNDACRTFAASGPLAQGFDENGQSYVERTDPDLRRACGNGGDPGTFHYRVDIMGQNVNNDPASTGSASVEFQVNGVSFFKVTNTAARMSQPLPTPRL